MKFRGTLITLVVAAALGGYLLYSERQSSERAVRRDKLSRLVKADDFESLRFAFSGKLIALQRRGSNWVLTHPVSAPADPMRLQAFVDTLRAARIEERVGAGDLARYGLDHPAAEVNIEARDGLTTRLRFGRINPLQTLVYVLVDASEEVVLTTSSLLTYSLTSDFGWRDKTMIAARPDEVVRMRFRTINAGSLSVRREPGRGWVAENRNPWRVDPLKAENVLRVFTNLNAVGVAAENKENEAKYGLAARQMRAVIEGENGRRVGDVGFGFARAEGTYYAVVPDKPEVFEVGEPVVTTYVEFTRDYRDRSIFPKFVADEVTRLEVSSPTDSFVVVRRSRDRWVVTRSAKHDSTLALDPALMTSMLEDLMTMQVVEFPKSQPPPAVVQPIEWRIDLFGADRWLSGIEVARRDPNGLHTFVRGTYDEWWVLLSVPTMIGLPFDLERFQLKEAQVEDGSDRG